MSSSISAFVMLAIQEAQPTEVSLQVLCSVAEQLQPQLYTSSGQVYKLCLNIYKPGVPRSVLVLDSNLSWFTNSICISEYDFGEKPQTDR